MVSMDEAGVRRLHDDSAVLAEIGRIITSSLEIDEVFDRFAQRARQLIPFKRIWIGRLDSAAGMVVTQYAAGVQVPGLRSGEAYPMAGTLTEMVAATQQGLVCQGEELEQSARRSTASEALLKAGMRATLLVPLVSRGRGVGVMGFSNDAPDSYSERDLDLAMRVAAQIAGALATADLYAERARMSAMLLQREKESTVLAEMSRVISSSVDIDHVYGEFAKLVQRLIPFSRIVVHLFDPGQGTVTIAYVSGVPVPGLEQGCVYPAAEHAPLQRVMEMRRGVVVDGIKLRRAASSVPTLTAAIELGMVSVIVVPLVVHDQGFGTLTLASHGPLLFSRHELEMAERVGAQIAGAVANSLLYVERTQAEQRVLERAREIAVLQERERIARELHDTLAQDLMGILLQLNAAGTIPIEDQELRERIARARSLAREGLEQVRGVLHDLTPFEMDGRPLEQVMRGQLERFSVLGGWRPSFVTTGDGGLPALRVRAALLRIAQEALANVNKHARATAVEMRLEVGVDATFLRIRDDGAGFDVETVRAQGRRAGFGVAGMEDRARLLGGSLAVRSKPGNGTCVDAVFPNASA